MINGSTETGTISTGDIDAWTFTASAGEAIVIRVGEVTDTSGNFEPWVRLYSPTGTLLDSGFGASAGEVTATAPANGVYLAVVGDGNGALSGTGDYRLTLAMTGSPIVITSGDEGGPLTNGVNPTGTITEGDIDLYSFTACKGENINILLTELTDTSGNFTP